MSAPSGARVGRRVVVTGSQGFVGRHLRAALALRGVEVVGVGRPGSGAEVEVDLARRDLDVAQLVGAIGPVDGVVDMAAIISRGSSVDAAARDNLHVIATRAVEWMEATHALSPGAHFTFCSSLKMYGPADGPIDPEHPPQEPDPWSYGCAKALAERLLDVSVARCGARWCTVRPTYVYGPGQHLHNAIPMFLRKAWEGEAPVVFGDGREVRDDVYVPDLAYTLAEACLRRATGAFHGGSGVGMTLLEVAQACCDAVAGLGGPRVTPRTDPSRPAKWWLDRTFDITRSRDVLGLRPTPMADALRREALWVRDGGRMDDAIAAAPPIAPASSEDPGVSS